jgi:hypothetical protein
MQHGKARENFTIRRGESLVSQMTRASRGRAPFAKCIPVCYSENMAEISFEWDEEKNKRNQQRHGIRFEDAKFVFNDPCRVMLPDL